MTRGAAQALPLALSALALVGAQALAGDIPTTIDATQVPAYRLIQPRLATAGQPRPEVIAKLKEMGFKTVINLRTEMEGTAAERAAVEAQGLRYVSVPITPASFSLSDVEAVERALAPESGPVLLHCASSNRVGAVWAVIQSRKGKTLAEAEAAGREAGMQPSMRAAVRRVLGVPADAAPAAVPAPAPKP
jgi:uncharacterized protein (TIGR01244 family)